MRKNNRALMSRLLRLLPRRAARYFVRSQDGAAAVEFGLVAVPFLALTFAIIETALVFFSGQTLEAAAATSARLIMTGQAQAAGMSVDQFKQAVCAQVAGLFDCLNGVTVDVKSYPNFASINTTPPVTNGQLNTANMAYQPGGPGSIVVVTLYYQWPIYVSLLGDNLQNMSGNSRLLVATSVFRNEPYQ
ncbi:MAG TPA: TadE/TadG family type IV pilus assembly protein [Pseudolabrys sp.]|nr:TadE/TadG family type IV pilus assembly protein [Pseudolabrys sp.]